MLCIWQEQKLWNLWDLYSSYDMIFAIRDGFSEELGVALQWQNENKTSIQ